MAYYPPAYPYYPAAPPAPAPQQAPAQYQRRSFPRRRLYRLTQQQQRRPQQNQRPQQQPKKQTKKSPTESAKKSELKELKVSKSSLKPGDVRSMLSPHQVQSLLSTIHENLVNGHGHIRHVAATQEDREGNIFVTPDKTIVHLSLHGLNLKLRVPAYNLAEGIQRVTINDADRDTPEDLVEN